MFEKGCDGKLRYTEVGGLFYVDLLKTDIDQYIRYYNHDRIKSKLKGLKSVDWRAQSLAIA
ncbi:IS3 family transposase [Methylotenera sp.]|uniref:IS3 family transposase n=1 Tax=Methylotenera sp. TaxID=2051956 RepID=UPI003452405A